MITTIDGEGNKTYHWKCQYCDFKLLSKQFSAAKARIHLTGDVQLRSGLINQVCTSSPTEVMCQMSAMIAAKRDRRTLKAASRSHKRELTNATMRADAGKKQTTIDTYAPPATSTSVDQALGEMFFGLSIAPNKANSPLFTKAIDAVKAAPRLYKPPNSNKLSNDILEVLNTKYRAQQRDYLEQKTPLGRAITGDGATILGNKLINFLCLDRMKGTMLMSVINCDKRLEDGAKVDTPYLASELLKVLGRVGHVPLLSNCL